MLQFVESILYLKFLWITAILSVLYVYLKFIIYAYWKKLDVPHAAPTIPFGNALPLILGKVSVGDHLKGYYEEFKKFRFSGMYMLHKPVLMINDPELIRQVLVKDFDKFSSRGMYSNEQVDPMTTNIFLLPGEKWRKLRAKLTPTFTSSKMKQIFPLIKEISCELMKTCDKILEESQIVEIKDLLVRYTLDTISSMAFGFNCNSLYEHDNEFKRHGLMVVDMSPIKLATATFAPLIMDIFRIPFLDKEMTKFFADFFHDMIKYRRQNNIVRKDFLNLLMQLMDKGALDDQDDVSKTEFNVAKSDEEKLTLVEAQAQSLGFFLAGYETSSSTMTYLLYELALNPEIQENVHREIDEFFAKGEATYARVKDELPYFDMVFSETLRKHSSFSSLNRMCVEDWKIPDTDIEIKKGTGIVISVSGLHHDPDIYPDPEKFDPTRFTKENIASRSPYTYLPFGIGPKACIGIRLGTLQSKTALIMLLSEYKLYTCEKTTIPVPYSKKSLVQTPGCDVYLRLEKRLK